MPDHLLVPIAVEALVVNEADRRGTQWSISQRHYTSLSSFDPIEPPPFVRGNDRPRIGVVVHWALPDALTRGVPNAAGRIEFPLIPNRWLVLRTARQPDGVQLPNTPLIKGWVIESDFLGNAGTNLYPTAQRGFTRLGRQFELGAWPAALEAEPLFLTALGGPLVSDPAFAANVAGIDNVLSFYDSLDKTETSDGFGGSPAHLSYAVVGWYSRDGADDPLQGLRGTARPEEAWQAVLDRFAWKAGDPATPPSPVPRRILCHGTVHGVNWTGSRGEPQHYARGIDSPFRSTGIQSRSHYHNPDFHQGPNPTAEFGDLPTPTRSDLPQVALGNSAEDAFAALVESLAGLEERPDEEGKIHGVDLSTAIQALDHHLTDIYDQPGGQVELEQRIHQEWFLPSSGGSAWEVLGPEREGANQQEAEALDETQVRDRLAALGLLDDLDELNHLQSVEDLARRRLAAARRELYDAWWKTEKRLSADLIAARSNAQQRDAEVTTAEDARRLAEQALRPKVTQAGMRLVERPGPRFFRPADPVVVIYGARRSRKHGADGAFSRDQKLECRFAEQVISGLRGRVNSGEIRERIGIDTLRAGTPQRAKIPEPAWDLAAEAILLDPGWAPLIAGASAGGLTAAAVTAAQRLVWQDFSALKVPTAEMTGALFAGVRPSPLAVEEWAQPWAPLYLAWRVTWYPTAYPAAAGRLPDWQFNGLDSDWAGVGEFKHSGGVTLQGRSLLTSTSTRAISQALEGLAELTNNPAAVARLTERLANADLLSQSLTGFHDQLLLRDPLQYYNPPPEINTLVGDTERSAPMPYRSRDTRSQFFPVRGGHFRVERLWIVDAYGQVFDPIAERGETAASFTPIRGNGLVTVGLSKREDTQMLQLPPRIVQASRVQFRFEHDRGAPSPVCGWLLPNHFDKSLTLFDSEGNPLGAILLAGSGSNLFLRWEPSVIGERQLVDPAFIADEHLRGFARALLQQTDNADAFDDLMEAIDRTLWTVDPLGQRRNSLTALIGRPIAVVRAKVQLELELPPASDQYFNLGPNDVKDRGLPRFRFAFEFGNVDLRDDGTLGYFLGQNYERFHAVHDVERNHPTYVVRPQPDRIAIEPTFLDEADHVRRGKTIFVTLLMDPRGAVSLRSGILPVKAIRLPRHMVVRPLERMDVTFRVGPVLHEPSGLRMPLPTEIRGGWSWIQKTGVTLSAIEESPVAAASHEARLTGTPVHVREGWLKLSDALGDNAGDRNT